MDKLLDALHSHAELAHQERCAITRRINEAQRALRVMDQYPEATAPAWVSDLIRRHGGRNAMLSALREEEQSARDSADRAFKLLACKDLGNCWAKSAIEVIGYDPMTQ